jgi:hypothetical protein
VRLPDIVLQFFCRSCGNHGADVRSDFIGREERPSPSNVGTA